MKQKCFYLGYFVILLWLSACKDHTGFNKSSLTNTAPDAVSQTKDDQKCAILMQWMFTCLNEMEWPFTSDDDETETDVDDGDNQPDNTFPTLNVWHFRIWECRFAINRLSYKCRRRWGLSVVWERESLISFSLLGTCYNFTSDSDTCNFQGYM